MRNAKQQMKIWQIFSIVIVLLFVASSVPTSVNVYKEYRVHSQIATSINETTVEKSSYNNCLSEVVYVGCAEIILIITTCYRLSLVAAVAQLLLTIGTLCVGYVEQQMQLITMSTLQEQATITSEITLIGYLVVLLAIGNVVMTIVLHKKKKALIKGEEDNIIVGNMHQS